MSTSFLRSVTIAVAGLALSALANAQTREPGWEVGIDGVYSDSTTFDFEGGSKINLDSDFGLSITFGYRINSHFETSFALDWSDLDYTVRLVTANGTVRAGTGELEMFTPRFDVKFNLFDAPFTPYVMAGVGYAFIDTNIPTGRPQTGCWWDPWYGYICTTVQDTATTDEFTYQGGIGVRWDFSHTGTLRLAYERHWLDIGRTDSTPFLDQVKLGFVFRY